MWAAVWVAAALTQQPVEVTLREGCFDFEDPAAAAFTSGASCSADEELRFVIGGIPPQDFHITDPTSAASLCMWFGTAASAATSTDTMPNTFPVDSQCGAANAPGWRRRISDHLTNAPLYWRDPSDNTRGYKIWVVDMGNMNTVVNKFEFVALGTPVVAGTGGTGAGTGGATGGTGGTGGTTGGTGGATGGTGGTTGGTGGATGGTGGTGGATGGTGGATGGTGGTTGGTGGTGGATGGTGGTGGATGGTGGTTGGGGIVGNPGPAAVGDELCSTHEWHGLELWMRAIVAEKPEETDILITLKADTTAWFGIGLSAQGLMKDSWAMVYSERGGEEYILATDDIGNHLQPKFEAVIENNGTVTMYRRMRVSEMSALYGSQVTVDHGESVQIIVACGRCMDPFGVATPTMKLHSHETLNREQQRMTWGSVTCPPATPIPSLPGPEFELEWWHILLIACGGILLIFGVAVAYIVWNNKRKRAALARAEKKELGKPLIDENEAGDTEELLSNSEHLGGGKEAQLESLASELSFVEDSWKPLPVHKKKVNAIPSDLIVKDGKVAVSPFDDPQMAGLKQEYQCNANHLTAYADKNQTLGLMLAEVESMVQHGRQKKRLPSSIERQKSQSCNDL